MPNDTTGFVHAAYDVGDVDGNGNDDLAIDGPYWPGARTLSGNIDRVYLYVALPSGRYSSAAISLDAFSRNG